MWSLLPFTFLSLLGCCSAALEQPEYFFQSDAYSKGELGEYVNRTFKTFDFEAPIVNIQQWSPECDNGRKLLLTVRGSSTPREYHGPAMFDSNGTLIWWKLANEPYEFEVQNYKGEDYITYWQGDDGVRGHGAGSYYMVSLR